MFQSGVPLWDTFLCIMKRSGSISNQDVLFFAGEIVFRPFDDGWLVVSVQSANWIVINTAIQKSMLESLIRGATIGEVMSLAKSEADTVQLKKLIAALYARDFARTDRAPEKTFLEGYRQLNCYLTNACNLRCSHCFMRSGLPLTNELPVSEWLRILQEFRSEGGESVTFSGGEPLMNHHFAKILEFASEIGLRTTVLSNGILWKESTINKLADYINEVQISIDGVDEASNAIIRGKGHFERVVDTVIQFANKGVRTSVATTFTFDNLQDDTAIRYKDFVNNIRCNCSSPVFFKLSKKVLAGRQTNYSKEEDKAFYNQIVAIEHEVDPGALFNNFIEGHTPNLVEKNCGFGGISIAADGEVYFCNRISEVESYGNIRDNSLASFMRIGHDLHKQTAVDEITPCKDCHLRYICCGGCRIDDCNFQGKLKHFNGNISQTTCTEEHKLKLEQKMIDSFNYIYKF